MRRKTPEDYHKLAEKRGFRWVGPEVPNTGTKTGWECERGHRWQAPYGRIQQGHGCPHCSGRVRKTPDDYHLLAAERGFHWLGPKVRNTSTKTRWRCEQGHCWEATYHNVRNGTGCPVCAGKTPKTPDDYHILAKDQNLHWLGPKVPTVTTKTWWQCSQGHRWEARFNDIQQRHSCPFCAGKIPKTPDDYHALAHQRGFLWLGPEVPTIKSKTFWACSQGHKWQTSYASIQRGNGCHFCSGRAEKTPDDYHTLAKERGFLWLGPEVQNSSTKTQWQCEHGHSWEATYHNIDRGTGCPACYGNVPKTPADYHTLAEERGFCWLGPEVPNVATKTWWKCPQGHCWETRYYAINSGYGCPVCAGTAPKIKEDYQILAEERGFLWIGPEVPDSKTKTWWECKEGHRWEARFNDVNQGTGCPICARDIAAEKLRNKPSDYHTLAEERGFLWLGPEVPTSGTKTWWECEDGHRWESSYSNIQSGWGCPHCSGRAPKTAEDYYALADERGFRWIGPMVTSVGVVTTWECDQNHQWEASYSVVKRRSGCPVCLDIVNGTRVSQVQRDLCELIGGELNHPFRQYNIDVAILRDGVSIGVEYDSWYWHAGREEMDAHRDEEMIASGWRILRIRSNTQLPSLDQINDAIVRLLAAECQVEIVLDDWGEGPTRYSLATR